MVVGPDQQVVVGAPIPLMMLFEIIDCTQLIGVPVPGDRQDGNVDLCELLFLRGHVLPIAVIGGVVKPTLEYSIWSSIDCVQCAKAPAAFVPGCIHTVPFFFVAELCLIGVFIVD